MTRTTYVPGYSSATIQTIPYLTTRERDGIIDALDAGELVGVVDADANAIVAVATPQLADQLEHRDDDALKCLDRELAIALSEIQSLTDIIGEVLAEKEPSDYRYRLEDAAYDVRKAIAGAIDVTEGMS